MSETTNANARTPATPVSETVTDSLGRALVIRRLDALAEMDLVEAAGVLAENRQWMLRATLAAAVEMIDGRPAWPVMNRQGIRNRVREVGSEGIAAVIALLAPEEAGATSEIADALAASKN